MKLMSTYPLDAATGGCFITRRYEVGPDERVLWLDIDTEFLPRGMLCLSEQAVELIVHEMGWELLSQEVDASLDALRNENIELKAQLAEVSDALGKLINVSAIQRAIEVSRRREADKAEMDQWLDSLPEKNEVPA